MWNWCFSVSDLVAGSGVWGALRRVLLAAPGIYSLTITGTIIGWSFNNGGDMLKLTNVANWGPLRLGNNGGYFYGASNMTATATDQLDLSGTTNLSVMFAGAPNFNGNVSGWNTASVAYMSYMFFGVALSAPNYNALLVGWGSQVVKSGVSFGAGTSHYSTGGLAEVARQHLITSHSWVVTDGGPGAAAPAQTIMFTSAVPTGATVSGPTYTPTATGGPSGPVVFTIEPDSVAVCSINAGVVSFTAAGSCVIDANQAANASYNPAPPVQQRLSVRSMVGAGVAFDAEGRLIIERICEIAQTL
ncbi:MAG: BspA family leucine-rich repeat surface protein [Actinomycetes bacterium]